LVLGGGIDRHRAIDRDQVVRLFVRPLEMIDAGTVTGGMVVMTRAEQYAAQFAAIDEAVRTMIAGCSEADWRRVCVDEGRTVGVVAHHIATVEGLFAGVIRALMAGQPASPGFSAEDVDQMNAQHAEAFATVGKAATLDLLRTNGAALTDVIAALDDAQLEQLAGVFGGHELRVAQVVEWAMIGHFQGHLANIRASLAA